MNYERELSDNLEACRKVAAQQHRDLMARIDANLELERQLKALQTAVAEHLAMMHCFLPNPKHMITNSWIGLDGPYHINDGTGHCNERHLTPEEQAWINENDSGSLHDALAESGYPVRDQYGNLDLPRMGR